MNREQAVNSMVKAIDELIAIGDFRKHYGLLPNTPIFFLIYDKHDNEGLYNLTERLKGYDLVCRDDLIKIRGHEIYIRFCDHPRHMYGLNVYGLIINNNNGDLIEIKQMYEGCYRRMRSRYYPKLKVMNIWNFYEENDEPINCTIDLGE